MHPPSDTESTPAEAMPAAERRQQVLAGGMLLLFFITISAGLVLGGEASHFVELGLQYLPFLLLAILGTLGLQQDWARWLSYIFALALQGLIALVVLIYFFMGITDKVRTLPDGTTIPVLETADWLRLAVLIGLLVLLFALCSAVLLPRVRVWLARWLPIDPANVTHILALWIVLYITTSAYTQLILLGGQPPLLTAINSGIIAADEINTRSELGQNLDLIYGLIWMLPLALVAAGWPLKRSLGATLQRLGLVLPTWRQLLFALLAALALAVLMGLLGEWLSMLWNWAGWPETDADAFEQLLGDLISPLGGLVIGISAGLGEELAVRGLLQPRLGLLLSNLAFTAIHAYQYSFDALLIVFILGCLLGIIRERTNTTTAAVVHGGYNAASVLAGLFGW